MSQRRSNNLHAVQQPLAPSCRGKHHARKAGKWDVGHPRRASMVPYIFCALAGPFVKPPAERDYITALRVGPMHPKALHPFSEASAYSLCHVVYGTATRHVVYLRTPGLFQSTV